MSAPADDYVESVDLGNKALGACINNKYYSGMCVRVYFGEYWVDEISEIEFSLQEQVAPIFGYASYTWDKVARGNRYVTGSFVVNYKEVGYLQTILNSLSSNMTENNTWFDYETFSSINEEKGKAHRDLKASDLIENFEELAESYEDALWGKDVSDVNLLMSRQTDSFFYGDRYNKDNTKMKDHGFNILMTYGSEDLNTGGATCAPNDCNNNGYYSNTAQTIVNVQLTGCSQRVDPSGNPVQEVYTFIAKDIQGNVQVAY